MGALRQPRALPFDARSLAWRAARLALARSAARFWACRFSALRSAASRAARFSARRSAARRLAARASRFSARRSAARSLAALRARARVSRASAAWRFDHASWVVVVNPVVQGEMISDRDAVDAPRVSGAHVRMPVPAPGTVAPAVRAIRPSGPWGTVAGPVDVVDMVVRERTPSWTVAAQTMTRAVAATTGRTPGRPGRRRCRLTRRRTARRPTREGTERLYQTRFMQVALSAQVHNAEWCVPAPGRCVRAPPRAFCRSRARYRPCARRPGDPRGVRCFWWASPERGTHVRRWRRWAWVRTP